jgi:hypothetical protein
MVIGLVLEKRERPDDSESSAKNQMNLSTKKQSIEKNLLTQLMVQFIDGPKSKET